MTKILLADDHYLIRDTWSNYLSQDPRFEVLGECSNSEEAVHRSASLRPDILLMDINMEPFSGIEATRQIKKVSPETRVIAVTLHDKVEMVEKILAAGAMGYVTKNSSAAELKTAILEVAEGRVFISDDMKVLLAQETQEQISFSPLAMLTEREKEVIKLLKLGRSSREISKELNISTHTVDAHRHNILSKLKVKNTASLIEKIHVIELYH